MYKVLVSGLAYDGGKSGISDYIAHVVEQLCEKCKVDILLLEKDIETFPVKHENLIVFPVSNHLASPAINALWHLFVLPFKVDRNKYQFMFLPAANRRLISWNPVYTIGTLHDLSQFHIAGKYDWKRMFYVKKILPIFLKRLGKVCAISHATKEDAVELLSLAQESIFVNYNGVNVDPNPHDHLSSEDLSDTHGISKNYLLYVSRIEHPGKNHLNLIKAFEQLPTALRSDMDLVFAGSQWNGAQAVLDYAAKSSVSEKIKFLGYVDDYTLKSLYANAAAHVHPSYFEGFGLPLVEAMAWGVPNICADTKIFREIAAEAGMFFDPDNPDEIAMRIAEVLLDDELRKRLIKNGVMQCEKFSWKRHAERIIEEYESNVRKYIYV